MTEELLEAELTEKAVTEASADTATDVEEVRDIVFEEALEAILFAAGHPVNYASIGKVLGMSTGAVKDRVFEYALEYNKQSGMPRGVMLLTFHDSCQLCTKEYYLPEIREALGIRKSGSLSTAAMETLAVVAYNQPVTRVFVDTIRKVDSSYAMNSLIDRGLIECVGRLDVPGRPMQYGITSDFLRCFGMKSIEDLPSASDELINMFESVREKEERERATDEAQITFDETNPEDMTITSEEEKAADNTDTTDNADGGTDTDGVDYNGGEAIIDDEPSAEDDIIDID